MKLKKYKLKLPKISKPKLKFPKKPKLKLKRVKKKKKKKKVQSKHKISRIPRKDGRLDKAWKYGATIYYISATILVLIVIYFSLREGI